MRTTVDLPPLVHQRVLELARRRGTSLSATVAELTARGLGDLGEPLQIHTDPDSGFPVVSVGRLLTSDDVADLIDDE